MNNNSQWKIRQIIAAPAGWKAVHCQQSENKQVKIFNRPILCWALVEVAGKGDLLLTAVRGVEQMSNQLVVVDDLIVTERAGEDGVEACQFFLGYDDPEAHKESDYWIEQANARLKRPRSNRETTHFVPPAKDSQS